MGMNLKARDASPSKASSLKDVKRRILDALGPEGIMRVYRELGVEIVSSNEKKAVCRVMGREHEDQNPSGVIFFNTGNYSASGNHGENIDILEFVYRHGNHGSFGKAVNWLADLAGVNDVHVQPNSKGLLVEEVFDYCRDGKMVFQKVRYKKQDGTKHFACRQPTGKESKPWEYNLDDVKVFLYNIDKWIEAKQLGVDPGIAVIVEGEKKANELNEAFESAGKAMHLAISQVHGANYVKGWPELVEDFQSGDEVVVIPDENKVGIDGGKAACRALLERGCKVKFFQLRQHGFKIPDGGDTSDFLNFGGDVKDLLTKIEECKHCDLDSLEAQQGGYKLPSGRRLTTARDLLKLGLETKWLWEGWIPKGAPTLLLGEPSMGKTQLSMELAKGITNGGAAPDNQPLRLRDGRERGLVLYICADHQHSEIADGIPRFGFDPDRFILNSEIEDPFGGVDLGSPEAFERLAANIGELKPDLVVIDPLTNASGIDIKDISESNKLFKPLQAICRLHDCAMLWIFHTNSQGAAYGRRALEKSRVAINVCQPDPKTEKRLVWVEMSRYKKPAALGMTIGEDGIHFSDPPELPSSSSRTGKKKEAASPTDGENANAVAMLRSLTTFADDVNVNMIKDACRNFRTTFEACQRARLILGMVESTRGSALIWSKASS